MRCGLFYLLVQSVLSIEFTVLIQLYLLSLLLFVPSGCVITSLAH